MRRLLCHTHQARHYNTKLAKVWVMTMAKKVDLHMRKKAVCGTRVSAPSGHVEVQVSVVHPRTPSPAGQAGNDSVQQWGPWARSYI